MAIRLLLLSWLLLQSTPAVAQELTPGDSARHLLNRLAFGPRPGEITEVAGFGVLRFAEQMLGQARPEDPALAARQREFDPDRFSAAQLWRRIRETRRLRRAAKADSAMDPSRGQGDEVRRTIAAYQQLTLVRAITGRDQLREVMADFWANHFNVYLNKGADRAYLPEYIETVIRPRALGRFEDLLVATAKSPAMLFYLDNVQSVAPGTRPPARLRNDSLRAKAPTGLNENYARELMELHTLGVDGGYTQRDVTEVARILTGWSISPPDRGSGFLFRPRTHDPGAKTFMGMRFPAGHGIDEGERLLHILATSPATMHHVSRKLCARFVADDPPDGCVDAAVHAWEESDGQILAVLGAIVHSPEFWSSTAVGSKVKSPLEFIASAARAAGIVPDTIPALALTLGRLGQPLFQQASPAGYPEREEDWVNSGALLQRMNLAVALAAGRIPGSHPDLSRLAMADGDRPGLLRDLDDELFADRMSPRTRDAITHELADLADPDAERMLAVGLALGSPEFQRQ